MKRFKYYFDHFVEFPGWPGLPEQEADPERILDFLRDIRKLQFDLIFQMQGNSEITNSLCALWGGKPVENFAFIANRLHHPIVVTGSAQEAAVLSALQERIKRPVVKHCGSVWSFINR